MTSEAFFDSYRKEVKTIQNRRSRERLEFLRRIAYNFGDRPVRGFFSQTELQSDSTGIPRITEFSV